MMKKLYMIKRISIGLLENWSYYSNDSKYEVSGTYEITKTFLQLKKNQYSFVLDSKKFTSFIKTLQPWILSRHSQTRFPNQDCLKIQGAYVKDLSCINKIKRDLKIMGAYRQKVLSKFFDHTRVYDYIMTSPLTLGSKIFGYTLVFYPNKVKLLSLGFWHQVLSYLGISQVYYDTLSSIDSHSSVSMSLVPDLAMELICGFQKPKSRLNKRQRFRTKSKQYYLIMSPPPMFWKTNFLVGRTRKKLDIQQKSALFGTYKVSPIFNLSQLSLSPWKLKTQIQKTYNTPCSGEFISRQSELRLAPINHGASALRNILDVYFFSPVKYIDVLIHTQQKLESFLLQASTYSYYRFRHECFIRQRLEKRTFPCVLIFPGNRQKTYTCLQRSKFGTGQEKNQNQKQPNSIFLNLASFQGYALKHLMTSLELGISTKSGLHPNGKSFLDNNKTKPYNVILRKFIFCLRFFYDCFVAGNNPSWIFISSLSISPPATRPLLEYGKNSWAIAETAIFYRHILYRSSRLRELLSVYDYGPNEGKLRIQLLQEAVDQFLDNGRAKDPLRPKQSMVTVQPLRSVVDSFGGKFGRFRQNLLGKRVNFSGRSVIVVGPGLQLHQCGLPYEMALTLSAPFLCQRFSMVTGTAEKEANLLDKYYHDAHQGLKYIRDFFSWFPVIINRAPSLHRLSMEAFQAVVIPGKAVQMHPLVCPPFNADFDGDQVAIHVPVSSIARSEAILLLLASAQWLSPARRDATFLPTQDMILGFYYMTFENTSFDEYIQGSKVKRKSLISRHKKSVIPLSLKSSLRDSIILQRNRNGLIFEKTPSEYNHSLVVSSKLMVWKKSKHRRNFYSLLKSHYLTGQTYLSHRILYRFIQKFSQIQTLRPYQSKKQVNYFRFNTYNGKGSSPSSKLLWSKKYLSESCVHNNINKYRSTRRNDKEYYYIPVLKNVSTVAPLPLVDNLFIHTPIWLGCRGITSQTDTYQYKGKQEKMDSIMLSMPLVLRLMESGSISMVFSSISWLEDPYGHRYDFYILTSFGRVIFNNTFRI